MRQRTDGAGEQVFIRCKNRCFQGWVLGGVEGLIFNIGIQDLFFVPSAVFGLDGGGDPSGRRQGLTGRFFVVEGVRITGRQAVGVAGGYVVEVKEPRLRRQGSQGGDAFFGLPRHFKEGMGQQGPAPGAGVVEKGLEDLFRPPLGEEAGGAVVAPPRCSTPRPGGRRDPGETSDGPLFSIFHRSARLPRGASPRRRFPPLPSSAVRPGCRRGRPRAPSPRGDRRRPPSGGGRNRPVCPSR